MSCSNTSLMENDNIDDNTSNLKNNILQILKNNSDAIEYLDYYSNSKIESIKYKHQINTNLSEPIKNFYFDIILDENLIEVIISTNTSQLKLISVINIKHNSIVKVAGIYEVTLG
ncbi:MAG: hypothetical protein HRU03_02950 [Nanoarchaeales archaeon]|nr:hypothetical protein [Nanoarchaeales archaeon]